MDNTEIKTVVLQTLREIAREMEASHTFDDFYSVVSKKLFEHQQNMYK